GNGMFPLRGGFAVDGNYSPIIFQGFGLNVSADQHRFDSEDNARLNAGPTHTRTEVKNIWRLMHGCANTLVNVLLSNAQWLTILSSNAIFTLVTSFANVSIFCKGSNVCPHGGFRYSRKPLNSCRYIADQYRTGGVLWPAINNCS